MSIGKRLSDYLTVGESDAILRTCNRKTAKGRRNFAIIKTLLSTGLRQGELIKLNRGDFKFEKGFLKLFVKGKGGYERYAFVRDPDVWNCLVTYWSGLRLVATPVSPAFLTLARRGGIAQRRISKIAIIGIVRRAASLAGIDKHVRPHILRHTFLTRHLQSGTDIRTVQALAGHKSLASTMHYLHTDEERIKAAVSKVTF